MINKAFENAIRLGKDVLKMIMEHILYVGDKDFPTFESAITPYDKKLKQEIKQLMQCTVLLVGFKV